MASKERHNLIGKQPGDSTTTRRRLATIYDAVAGRIGPNGFLSTEEQTSDTVRPLGPEKVLLRRLDVPHKTSFDRYDVTRNLAARNQQLPDAELLKDIHTYVADFYEATSSLEFDFRSFDETALMAVGILLEEAVKEALGESGDLVFSEPQSADQGLADDKRTRHQIIGKVIPRFVQEYQSASDDGGNDPMEAPDRKRQRRRYRYSDE